MQMQNQRRAERIDTHLKIGYSCAHMRSELKERHVNISPTGIAFEVDTGFMEWAASMSIQLECPNGELYELKGRYVRHVLGKPGWMAFEFEEGDQAFFNAITEFVAIKTVLLLAKEHT